MTVERGLRLMAGFFILLSVGLGIFHSPYWFIFTALVGLNLFQSAFTNWCPMVWILEKIGLERCHPVSKAAPASKAAAASGATKG